MNVNIDRYGQYALAIIILSACASAFIQTNFTASGTWTNTNNVTLVYVEVWGGGGGGMSVGANANQGSSGGGGGAYSAGYVTVTPNGSYAIVVGAGGAGATGGFANATSGASSNFHSSAIYAEGGFAACGTGPGCGGHAQSGGRASQGIGDTKYGGGNGSNGTAVGAPSGGGGGGAGSGGYGGNGSGLSGGTGTAVGGGNGGNGRNTDGTGNAGSTIGGGGGGAFCDAACAAKDGGNGARGEVRITEITPSANVRVYDENTLLIINTTTVTIVYASSNFSSSVTTTTGLSTITLPGLDNYTFQFSAAGYSTRNYVLAVNNVSNATLNAYLSATAQNVTFTVQDQDAGTLLLEGVQITMQKLISFNWTTIQTSTTDISGSTTMSYTPSTRYLFIVSKAGYTTKTFYLDPVQFPAYTIRLSRTTTASNPQDYAGISTFYEPRVFRNAATNDFNFTISEPGGTLTSYTLTLTYPGGSNTTTGNTSTGQTIHFAPAISGAAAVDFAYGTLTYSNALVSNRQFNFTIPIDSTPSHPNTIATSNCTQYGLGAFECATIATVTTIIVGGIGFLYGGPLGSGALVLIFLGFFAKIGFFSIYAILGSVIVGFAIIAWRSSE